MTLRNYLCDVIKKLVCDVIKELAVIQEELQKTKCGWNMKLRTQGNYAGDYRKEKNVKAPRIFII